MNIIVNGVGFTRTDGIDEVGECLKLYLFDRAETEEQVAGGLGTYTGNVGEGGAEGTLGAFVAVVCDGEAMYFVLYLLEKMEERIGGLELDGFNFAELGEG